MDFCENQIQLTKEVKLLGSIELAFEIEFAQGKAECNYCYLQRIIKQVENAGATYRLLRARNGMHRPVKGFNLMIDGKKMLTFRTLPNRCICNE
jgi:hypothetical protein